MVLDTSRLMCSKCGREYPSLGMSSGDRCLTGDGGVIEWVPRLPSPDRRIFDLRLQAAQHRLRARTLEQMADNIEQGRPLEHGVGSVEQRSIK